VFPGAAATRSLVELRRCAGNSSCSNDCAQELHPVPAGGAQAITPCQLQSAGTIHRKPLHTATLQSSTPVSRSCAMQSRRWPAGTRVSHTSLTHQYLICESIAVLGLLHQVLHHPFKSPPCCGCILVASQDTVIPSTGHQRPSKLCQSLQPGTNRDCTSWLEMRCLCCEQVSQGIASQAHHKHRECRASVRYMMATAPPKWSPLAILTALPSPQQALLFPTEMQAVSPSSFRQAA
jgi:hypothetical protein